MKHAFIVIVLTVASISISMNAVAKDYYQIVSKNSQKCLDVEAGSKENGANIQQWSCFGGNNQKWELRKIEGDYYQIISKESDKCLDVENRSMENGANVHQWRCVGEEENWNSDNQKWKLRKVGSYYQIISKRSDKCLDVENRSTENGANVQQWRCVGEEENWNSDNQKWEIKPDPFLSIHVDDSLLLDIPCVEYGGNNYSFRLDYYPNPNDPAGIYWKMDINSFTEILDSSEVIGNYVKIECIHVDGSLLLDIPCVEYGGNNYSFRLDYYPNPNDPAGIYWKMDINTFTQKVYKNSIGMEFAFISKGTYMKGSELDEKNDINYKPKEEVSIQEDFYIQATEVTQGQFKEIMGYNPSYFKNCGDNCPVENVTWEQ